MKRIKMIDKRTKEILRDWLGTLVAKADENQIPLNKVKAMLPKQDYIVVNNQVRLSAYSYKWVKKALKALSRQYPERSIENFTMEHVEGYWRRKGGH